MGRIMRREGDPGSHQRKKNTDNTADPATAPGRFPHTERGDTLTAYRPPRDEMRIRRLQTIVDGRPMTQNDMSRKLRVPQTTYSSWERGVTTPPPKHQKKLIKLLNLPKDYFKEAEEESEDDE